MSSRQFIEEFRAERIIKIMRMIQYTGPLYIFIVGIAFIYADNNVSDYAWASKWRLPSVILAIFLVILAFSKQRRNVKLIFYSYQVWCFLICFMVAGITWEVIARNMELERAISGVAVAVFAVYIGSYGGSKAIAISYSPLFVLPFLVLVFFGEIPKDFMTYANPTALMTFCVIAAQVSENLRYREFSNRKKAEIEKQKADNALKELRAAQAQLIHAEKMASLGELTAGIAHEIQNPLNFVNNFSEVSNELIEEMQEELDKGDVEEAKAISSDIKQNLEKITRHGKRADAIVKGMLAHSRVGKGEKAPTNINALAEEYLKLSYHGIKAKDINFKAEYRTDFDPDLPKVNIVPQDMGRVLLNLINNAFQAVQTEHAPSVQRALITVSTKMRGDHIEISISDNGPGIPDAIKDKIFQPFFTTKPTGQGTGLGLSLSYDIVKAHEGEISVQSAEGEGSEFKIYIPQT